MTWLPTLRVEVVNVAWPLVRGTVAKVRPSSWKVTVPVGMPAGGNSGVTVAQEHAHAVFELTGYGQIQLAVAVEVPHRHRLAASTDSEDGLGGKAPVAIAQEHAHGVEVGDREVQPAIPVEIPHRQRHGV